MGMDTELQVEPMTRCTLFWLMNRLTLAMPLSGLHSSSSRITSTFAPLMPPLALTASISLFAMSPYAIPDSTIIRSVMPTRMVLSCATAELAATHNPSRAPAPAPYPRFMILVFICRILLTLRQRNWNVRFPNALPSRHTFLTANANCFASRKPPRDGRLPVSEKGGGTTRAQAHANTFSKILLRDRSYFWKIRPEPRAAEQRFVRKIGLPHGIVHAMMRIPCIALFNYGPAARFRPPRRQDARPLRRDLSHPEHNPRCRAARIEPADGQHLAIETAAGMARPALRAHFYRYAPHAARRRAYRAGPGGAFASSAGLRPPVQR